MLTDTEKQILVLNRVAEELRKGLGSLVPENGDFKPFGFTFDVYGTKHKGILRIEYKRGTGRMLRLCVLQKGTDRLHSNYLYTGTNPELDAYLKDPQTLPQWLSALQHLSTRADKDEVYIT